MRGGAPSSHSKQVWDKAWGTYDRPPDDYHEPLVGALVQRLAEVKGARVLEIGAGSARDSLRLAEMGAVSVAVDYSSPALELARRGMDQRGVELLAVKADGFQLPFRAGVFDAVFSQGVVEHFVDPRPLLDEQIRVLRPGGVLLVDVPQRYHVYTLRKHLLMKRGTWFAGWETSYSLGQLERLLESKGLSVVHSYGNGYFPRQVLFFRNAHTFDVRHDLPLKLPASARSAVEGLWQGLERRRFYYRWMWNIGVVAQKQ